MNELENCERVESVRKPRKCPACGFSPVATIQYGYPSPHIDWDKEFKSGRRVLGGCIIEPDNPVWYCTNCKLDIFRKKTGETFYGE